MRLCFTSDLHVDHHPEVVDAVARAVRAHRADVLVVAGDVSPHLGRLGDALRAFADAAPVVAFVPGNHDLWCASADEDSRSRYLETLPRLCRDAGVHPLHVEALPVNGAVLVGQTGWYDYSLRDPTYDGAIPLDAYHTGRYGRLQWTDKRFCRWPGDDEHVTAWMADRLRADLERVSSGRKAVVVTHMLPFDDLAARPPLPWAFVRGFLGATRLGDVILEAARGGVDVARVVAGHTHHARTAHVDAGGRTLVAETSPIGYPREYRRDGDLARRVADRVRVVEVS